VATTHPPHQLPPHLQPPKKSRAPLFIGAGVVVLAVVAFLAFGVFGVQTLFTDKEVAEAGPTFDSGAAMPGETEGDAAGGDDSGDGSGGQPDGPVADVAGSGTFEERDHAGAGTVNLLTDGTQTFVRFEDDFSTDNGPDLYAVVYVDGEIVELGKLKGNQGSQNYELPADIDPGSVESVAVWCKRFDSVFTQAPLA